MSLVRLFALWLRLYRLGARINVIPSRLLSVATSERLRQQLQDVLPGPRVLVLDGTLSLAAILRAEEASR